MSEYLEDMSLKIGDKVKCISNLSAPWFELGETYIYEGDNTLSGVKNPSGRFSKQCRTCSSFGFADSVLPDQCEFCDGTFGGHPPEEFQERYMKTLVNTDLSEIERRIHQNVRGHSKQGLQYLGSMCDLSLVGRRPLMMILDDWIDNPTWYDSFEYKEDGRGQKDWARTKFKRDSLSSTPSAAKRAKLRAKRKKRNATRR